MSDLNKQMEDLSPSEMKQLDKQVKAYIKGGGQVGAGFFKKLISKIKKGRKKVQKKIVEKGKEVATKAIDTVAGCKNKRTDPPFDYKKKPNEWKHQTFLIDGCSYSAAWSGPGTIVLPKIAELWAKYNGNVSEIIKSSNFVSPIDRQAMAHDLRYLLAGDEPDKDKSYQMIRDADEKFIKRLEKFKSDKNTLIPLNAMKAKVLFEKAGGKQYSGNEPIKTEEQRQQAKQLLAALTQSGEGRREGEVPSRDASQGEPRPREALHRELLQLQSEARQREVAMNQLNERIRRALEEVQQLREMHGDSTRGNGKKKGKYDAVIDAIRGGSLYLPE